MDKPKVTIDQVIMPFKSMASQLHIVPTSWWLILLLLGVASAVVWWCKPRRVARL